VSANSPGSTGGSAICGCTRCFAGRAGDNPKKTYRLYKAEDLTVRRHRRRRPLERERPRLAVLRERRPVDRPRFRCLCLVDDGTRESPALLVDFSIARARVVRALDDLAGQHGLPDEIVMDNRPEFTAARFLPGRHGPACGCAHPARQADPERVRGELHRQVPAWRQHYNREQPHSALGYEPPQRFARQFGAPGLATTSISHLHHGPDFGGMPQEHPTGQEHPPVQGAV